ncbi:MAG: damage-inducible protein DinB [Chlorobiaceae bacterium]|nr:damage-inducible protein DinB [Chlorobiaceae bacterium]NTV59816.1 damage-inducible protein DinB [Chlorobiaceae bacterium]
MDALTLLRELSEHTEWADSIVFSAISGNPAAGGDDILLNRLRHLHLVQKVFLDVWRGNTVNPEETTSLDLPCLMEFARRTHSGNREHLSSLLPGSLDLFVRLPWAGLVERTLGFKTSDPSIGQSVMQVYAHSAYHRGQVNMRLRELGIEPPMTDYIAWVWSHKPSPQWPDNAS